LLRFIRNSNRADPQQLSIRHCEERSDAAISFTSKQDCFAG